MKTLRVLLWDQSCADIPTLKDVNKDNDVIFFCEVKAECTYVKHHKMKLVFLLSVMRHFAADLVKQGYEVHYITLDAEDNTQTLTGEIARAVKQFKISNIVITWPAEYRLYEMILTLKNKLKINVDILEDTRFLTTLSEFKSWSANKKSVRMEFFYREMRKKYQILMFDNIPEGGKWNYDAENRQFPSKKIKIVPPFKQKPDEVTRAVMQLINTHFADHFGDLSTFHYAVTRKDALAALAQFIETRLLHFGEYQDVMMQNEPWLFHSHISLYINNGLLNPLECIKAAESAYYRGHVGLPAAEGFIRQILGWREFVRGIYWLQMPAYKNSNYFNATRPLPHFYWTAETKMNCIKQCVSETRANAYAHHIQRLMVLGNFALLAGIDPAAVNEWYLLVYADAHEWVELPNVTGMILFADGGYLASKPYAASGAYINKMSNYCENCHYKVKIKNGDQACPFNYLYWNFLLKHRQLLKSNQRLSMIYSSLARMSSDKIAEICADAEKFLQEIY